VFFFFFFYKNMFVDNMALVFTFIFFYKFNLLLYNKILRSN